MCGNGIRCVARFLADLEGKKAAEYKIHTPAGTIIPVVRKLRMLPQTVDDFIPQADYFEGPCVISVFCGESASQLFKKTMRERMRRNNS